MGATKFESVNTQVRLYAEPPGEKETQMKTKAKHKRNRSKSAVPLERREAYLRSVQGPTLAAHVARMRDCMADLEALVEAGHSIHTAGAAFEIRVCALAIAGLTPANAAEHAYKLVLLEDFVPRFDHWDMHDIARIIEASLVFERARDVKTCTWANGRH